MTVRCGLIAAVCVFALGVACEDADNAAPALSGIAPSTVVQGLLPETVAVTGSNLFGVAVSSLDDDPPTVDNEWSAALDGSLIEAIWLDDTRVDVVVPAGTAVGVYDVAIAAPDGTVLELLDALTVTADPVGLAVTVEDAPGGTGTPIGDRTLMIDDALTVHAVIYDTGGAFFMDAEVTWSVSGGIGTIFAGPSTSATFTAEAGGQGVITAAHLTADDGTTGAITVDSDGDTCMDCVTGECLDVCTEPSCIYDCDQQCDCVFDCTDVTDTCDATCRIGTACEVDCTGANKCDLVCEQTAVCDFGCVDAGECEVVCRNSSVCTVVCDGSDCSGARCENSAICSFDCTDAADCGDIDCTGVSECLLDCTGATPCNFAVCDGGEMSCPGDVVVCNRGCP